MRDQSTSPVPIAAYRIDGCSFAAIGESGISRSFVRVGNANYAKEAGCGMVPRIETENEKTGRSRRRFSAEEKARIVGRHEQSGLTRVEFCRREGSESV